MSWPQAPENEPDSRADLTDPPTRRIFLAYVLVMALPALLLPLGLWLAYDPLSDSQMQTLCLDAVKRQRPGAASYGYSFTRGSRNGGPQVSVVPRRDVQKVQWARCLVEKRRRQQPSVILEWF